MSEPKFSTDFFLSFYIKIKCSFPSLNKILFEIVFFLLFNVKDFQKLRIKKKDCIHDILKKSKFD